MITELFLVGSTAFWVLLAFGFLLLSTAASRGHWGLPAFCTVILGALFFGFTDLSSHSSSWDPLQLFLGLVIYLLAGSVWSLYKWLKLTQEIRLRIEGIKNDYTDDASMRAYGLRDHFVPNDIGSTAPMTIPPTPGEFHSRITGWIAFWPACMTSGIFCNVLPWLWSLISGIFSFVAKKLRSIMDRISNSSFEDYQPLEKKED